MCNIYAKADTMLYESRTRSLRIRGVLTTIRLENHFWDVLAEMAEREGFSTNQLIVKLHDELTDHRDEATNFTSFLRVCCLRYMSVLAGRLTAPEQTSEPLLRAVR
jgi:predicted DNA-binding ribbon-helix-helix protein